MLLLRILSTVHIFLNCLTLEMDGWVVPKRRRITNPRCVTSHKSEDVTPRLKHEIAYRMSNKTKICTWGCILSTMWSYTKPSHQTFKICSILEEYHCWRDLFVCQLSWHSLHQNAAALWRARSYDSLNFGLFICWNYTRGSCMFKVFNKHRVCNHFLWQLHRNMRSTEFVLKNFIAI
jgi:hypothetical protein